jgi:alpha 1,2-mannosyltransferase
MNFFRSEAYQAYFDFLDKKGGFYYEVCMYHGRLLDNSDASQRWGDAPIHSIAVALLAPKSSIHFFREIGYRHPPVLHCPRRPKPDGGDYTRGRCDCNWRKTYGESPRNPAISASHSPVFMIRLRASILLAPIYYRI